MRKIISVRTGIFHTEFTEFTETFLYRGINNPYMEQMESTELVADFVTTAGAMGTETIGANTAPARRFSPERQFCGFKMQFTHTRNISPEWKICEFCEFCVRKNIRVRREYISHRIHRICRRLRRDGWRDGERMTKTLNYKTEG